SLPLSASRNRTAWSDVAVAITRPLGLHAIDVIRLPADSRTTRSFARSQTRSPPSQWGTASSVPPGESATLDGTRVSGTSTGLRAVAAGRSQIFTSNTPALPRSPV